MVSDFIQEHQPTSFVETGRKHLAVALFSIALSHREAVLLLANFGAWASAFALQRSIWEAYMRGYHVQHCLSDEQHGRMQLHKASPTMETVAKELEGLGPEYAPFGAMKRLIWEPLSDYSHGGVRQVSRWLRGGTIEPNYSDDEVIECLWFANMFGLYASVQICLISRGDPAPYNSLALQLIELAHHRQSMRTKAA